MKQLVKGSAVLTAVSIGEMAMRFIRTKCIALFLGPAGTGFLAQLIIFFEIMRVLGDMGARRGVIKQIAELRQAGRCGEKYGEVIRTSYFLALIASGVTGVAATVFSPAISQSLYGTPEHYPFIVFIAFLLPLASLSTVTASIVKGNLDYLPFAKYTFAAYLLVMLMTPLLIYFARYWGAVLVQGLFFIVPLVSYLVFNSREKFISLSKKISFHVIREQVSYGSIQVYQDSLHNFSKALIAAWIVKDLGLPIMGMYQVVVTFSMVYMAIPIQAMSGYAMPMMSSAKNNGEVTEIINNSLRYLMFLLVPVIVGVMVLSEMFIYLFFSADFLPAAGPLQIQLLGTLFNLASFAFVVALQARGRLKALFVMGTVMPLLYVGFVRLLFDRGGLTGVAAAFTASNFIGLAVFYSLARHYFNFRLEPKNVRLMSFTAVLAVAAWWAGSMPWGIRAGALFLMIPWFFLSSKQHERDYLIQRIHSLKDFKKIFRSVAKA